jgi:hypothetical protein
VRLTGRANAQATGRQSAGRGSPRRRPRVAKAQATGRQGTGHGSRQGAGAAPNRPLVRPRLANMVADPGSVVDRVYPRARCQGRTPTGAAAHDRGDGQALRFGQPPPWSGPDTIRETVKPHLMSIKGCVREPLLPDLAGMMAHRAGNSRHNGPLCRLEIPVRSRYLEFVCVQVRVGLGNPAILYAQRPTAGIVRVRWSPVHPIHPQARIHHANPRSPYSGASEGVNGAREAATSVRQPVLGVPRGRGQNPARKPPGSTQTTPGPGRVLRPHVSQFARPVDNLPDLLSLL